MITNKKHGQSGEVSMFVVIFAALLIIVVTISFVRIMTQSQQQATANDLSQSAYDSAQAGVEDAKRALLRYQTICQDSDEAACKEALTKISVDTCNTAVDELEGIDVVDNEVDIKTGGDNALDQAYTCVKITPNTIDFVGNLTDNGSKIIPLRGVEQFDTIQIQWFTHDDFASSDTSNDSIELQPISTEGWPLLAKISWGPKKPPIMRTQLIQFSNSGFNLDDFNNTVGSESNANTIFLYPSGTTGVNNPTAVSNPDIFDFINRDTRRTATAAPLPVRCTGNLSSGGYACTVKLTLPSPINASDSRTAFLRLSAIYNSASYRVTLINSSGGLDTNIVFDGVQPSIDSTGRANDLFRRVQARVELNTNFPYPEAEINTSGNICKDFLVTDSAGDYQAGTCTP